MELLMANHTQIQRLARNEILENIGTDRLPRLSDRSKLRYTDAVLLEIQRFSSIVATGMPHRVIVSCKVCGFDIPADAVILTNLYAVHHDPSIWKSPDSFDPEANFIHRDKTGAIELINT